MNSVRLLCFTVFGLPALLAALPLHAQTSTPAAQAAVPAPAATNSKDLSATLYEQAKPSPATAKAAVKTGDEAGSSAIIRCVANGRVTFTNTKCETGQTATGAIATRKAPAENQLTRSTGPASPKPLAALPPLYDTVQPNNSTAGYELREQCAKLNGQLARLDSQAQLALPKPEPEANRKKREDIERKKFSLRCP
jgi:hypothetical protein